MAGSLVCRLFVEERVPFFALSADLLARWAVGDPSDQVRRALILRDKGSDSRLVRFSLPDVLQPSVVVSCLACQDEKNIYKLEVVLYCIFRFA